jgi:hypothetical protein
MEKTVNYTATQEALIAAQAPVDFEKAQALASLTEMNTAEGVSRKARSIVAKAVRMGVYSAAARVTKSGEAVVREDELVAQIARSAGVSVDALAGLEKSPKGALQSLRAALAA